MKFTIATHAITLLTALLFLSGCDPRAQAGELRRFEYHDAVPSELRGFHTTPSMRTALWGVTRESR